MSDIEIARAATAQPIQEIADKVGIPADAVRQFGQTKAKIDPDSMKSAFCHQTDKSCSENKLSAACRWGGSPPAC